jgi:CRP/FNR family cyclic AMP-dependent transcriptional regulator
MTAHDRPNTLRDVRPLKQDAKVDALRRVPLFDGLSKKELTEIARATDDLRLDAGTVLCREGRIGNEFFVLVEGSVDVIRGDEVVSTRSGGDFVGEIALLVTKHRVATVRATTPVRCLVLTRGDFRRVLDENRAIEQKVMTVLATRLAANADHDA